MGKLIKEPTEYKVGVQGYNYGLRNSCLEIATALVQRQIQQKFKSYYSSSRAVRLPYITFPVHAASNLLIPILRSFLWEL